MRSPVNRLLPLAALALISGCGGGDHPQSALPASVNGPAADYPIVVGEPFVIGGVTHTPIDRLNFDAVGYASVGTDGGDTVSGAHKTLPLPSYVEVTALDTGKTILVRIERRGPMVNDRLVELSPGAAAQLGLTAAKAPVRVRRVNPPEPERALLRSGQRAPARMDTPKALLSVLIRRLDGAAPVLLSDNARPSVAPNAARPRAVVPNAAPAQGGRPKPAATIRPQPVVPAQAVTDTPPRQAPVAAQTGLVVQIGAFSSRVNANAAASKVGGSVSAAGNLFRVRTGPYASRADAEAALAKARGAGYTDARIQRAN